MNILQLVSSSRTSGAEKNVILLSKQLIQRGHNVLAICPPGGWLPGQLRAAGILTLELPMRGTKGLGAALEISKVVRNHHIEIVNAHLTRATYIGYLSGFLAKVPVISTVQIWSRDISYRMLTRRNLWLVAVSDYIRKDLIARGACADRIRTVYNCTELSIQDAGKNDGIRSVHEELNLPQDSLIVGLVGRVDRFKGAHILVSAARSIVEEYPDAYVVFVGKGEPKFIGELQQIAEADGVLDHLRFTGVRNDVARYIAAMDIVTLPSISEACSLSIIEAMALGKPVVATRAGGNLELVDHGVSGLLVARDAESFSEAIISLLKSPDKRTRMGLAAQARAENAFTAEIMATNMETMYEFVLKDNRSTPKLNRIKSPVRH